MSDTGNVNVGDNARINGPAVGYNTGAITTNYTILQPPRDGPAFSIPYPAPSAALVGRDTLLVAIRERLCTSQQMSLALTGLPGAGKTSLALALAYDIQIRKHFGGGILMASLGQNPELSSVARRWTIDLGMQLDMRGSLDEQFQYIAARLHRAAVPCLIIIDDVWKSTDVTLLRLNSPYIKLLFTGRQRDAFHSFDLGDLVGPEGIIIIPSLDENQAVELLRLRAELPAPNHQVEIEALASLIGGLPLLLDAMGRYLRDQRQLYQEQWFKATLDDLQSAARRLNLPVTSITQVRTNLQTGFFARFRRKPITVLNTRLLIDLSVHALPRDVQTAFVRLAALPPDPLTFGGDSAEIVAEATDDIVRLLVRRSLLSEAGEGRFRLHRVLWDWAENQDSRAVRQARQQLADWHADLTKANFADEFGVWRLNPDNWQHMLQTWRAAVNDAEALRGAISTILPLLIDQGYAQEVLPGLMRALEIFRRVDHSIVIAIHYYLGLDYYHLAKYDQSRLHLSTALSGFQTSHSDKGQVATLSLLGMIEEETGHYDIAMNFFEEALHLTLETEERNYAVCLNNLAGLLRSQGEYAAARPLYERALQITEQALGPQHPSTATSLNNLALLLKSQGEYAAARPLYERALQIREQVLGPLHPSTATSLNNLAGLLESQGEYAAARPLYERALQIREQVLGPLHPSTAMSLNNLALLLMSQGEYAAARPLFERALQITEQVLGPQHPSTATCLNNLALLLKSQGEYAAARPLFERALQIREQVLGLLHPDTATSLNNLAGLLKSQGEYAAARPLYERALQITEQVLGPLHPDTAMSLNNLAGLLESQGEYAAARPLYERALEIFIARLGEDHHTTHIARKSRRA